MRSGPFSGGLIQELMLHFPLLVPCYTDIKVKASNNTLLLLQQQKIAAQHVDMSNVIQVKLVLAHTYLYVLE